MCVEEQRDTAIADVTYVFGIHEHEVVQVRVGSTSARVYFRHQLEK